MRINCPNRIVRTGRVDKQQEDSSELKILREPLLHFLFIGAAIYLLYGTFAEPLPEGDDKTIVVSAGEIEWMQTG
jgi:hypothetical protein